MRLIIALLLFSITASAQVTYQGGVTTTVNNRGALTVDSMLKIPERDTTNTFTTQRYRGRITVSIDSNLYYHNGKSWVRLSNQTTDTTSLSNRINQRIPYTDTTTKIATRNYVNTFTGSTSITTVGTIGTGTWSGTTIATNKGGTGLTSIGTANQVLGVNSGATGLEYKSFATGTSGTDFTISHSANTVTFNLPTASASNRGLLSSANWTTFNNKIGGSGTINTIPMFSDSSTLVTSGLRSNGSHFSINDVVDPSYALYVNGYAKIAGIRTANADGVANVNNTGLNFVTHAGTGVQINTINGGYYIDIREGGTVRLRIGDGKVLVNSTSFRGTGALEVTGNVSVLGTTSNTYRWDATSGTPTNTATPAGWVKISVAGVDAWLPYYQ